MAKPSNLARYKLHIIPVQGISNNLRQTSRLYRMGSAHFARVPKRLTHGFHHVQTTKFGHMNSRLYRTSSTHFTFSKTTHTRITPCTTYQYGHMKASECPNQTFTIIYIPYIPEAYEGAQSNRAAPVEYKCPNISVWSYVPICQCVGAPEQCTPSWRTVGGNRIYRIQDQWQDFEKPSLNVACRV